MRAIILVLAASSIAHAEPPQLRWEGTFGFAIGGIKLDQQSLEAGGAAASGGIRGDSWAAGLDVERLGVTWPMGASTVRGDGEPPAGSDGTLNRVGINARYRVVRLGSDAPDLHEFFEAYVVAGTGAQHIDWDAGGALWRSDVALGGAFRLYGVRISDTRTIGLLVRVVDVMSHRGPHATAATCSGPCDTATPPTRWDTGTMVTVSLAVTD